MSARGGPPTDERRPGQGGGGHVEAGQADAASVVVARTPGFASVDEAVFVPIVVAWLTPLSPDRGWSRRRWQTPRGEATWVGGAVGLHVPAPREAS